MTQPPSAAPPEDVAGRRPVAIDAMGGDRAPAVVVEGAILACEQGHGPIILVGDEDRVRDAMAHEGAEAHPIEVVHAAEIIGMAEHPGRAARAKRESSMHVGFRLVKERRASAFVSAGNTGAMMAVGLLTLRRVKRCERPAVASVFPTRRQPIVLLDMGANVECRASHLVQFALMGAAYAEVALGRERPTVALLSNGTEPNKGTEVLREAHRLLTTTDLKYVGFIEGRDLPQGEVDVVVTDGFTGNVVLKVSEGIALALLDLVRDRLKDDLLGSIGAWMMKRALRGLRDELDWVNVGGAPLLGINGIGVVAHGGSNAPAIANAVRLARESESVELVNRLGVALRDSGPPEEALGTAELPITRASGAHARDPEASAETTVDRPAEPSGESDGDGPPPKADASDA